MSRYTCVYALHVYIENECVYLENECADTHVYLENAFSRVHTHARARDSGQEIHKNTDER